MKRKMVWLLSLFLALHLGMMNALAAANQSFLGNVHQEQEGRLEIVCAIPGEIGEEESFQVLLGDQKLSILSAAKAGQPELPMTVYCLVDISGSMKGHMEAAQETLTTISSGLQEGDNLIIGRMGNQITDTALLTDPEEIKMEIEKLAYTGEDTDLYSGLVHGLRFLQQEPGIHHIRALVVLSDGCDDQGDGSTWKEAYDAVEKADIPVYTVALIKSAADYEKAKELGSFARNSAGGKHFPLSDDSGSKPLDMTGAEMGAEVREALDHILSVTADLSDVVKTEKDTYTLTVSFQGKDGRVYEDSKELAAKDLILATESRDSANEEIVVIDVESEPLWKQPAMIVSMAAILLVAVLILILIRNQRKAEKERKAEAERQRKAEEKKNAEELERRQQEEIRKRAELERKEQEEQERQRILMEQQKEMERQRAREEAIRRQQQAAYQALPRLFVRLAAVGKKNKIHMLELVKGHEMTIGRNGKASIVLDSEDQKLSSIHFAMFWDGKSVYVWDCQSKNGTSVNGVVVNHLGRVAVRPGDSLRVGDFEYRLYWED